MSIKIKEALRHFAQELSAIYDTNEAKNIANLVIEKITNLSSSQIICQPEQMFSKNQAITLEKYKNELFQNRPLQYVLGQADFYGMQLFVDESVLIPRPETEELVAVCLKNLSQKDKHNKSLKLLDIGTGSGCIAIALKKNLPKTEVFAVDYSTKALATAKKNALILHADIRFYQWDILHETPPEIFNKSLDIIVSNPPYITMDELSTLKSNVRDYEPKEALFVTNQDPLQFYKKIEQLGKSLLNQNGQIYLELHETFAEKTKDYFLQKGWKTKLLKDFQNKNRILIIFKN